MNPPPQQDEKQIAAQKAAPSSKVTETSLTDCFLVLGFPRQPWLDPEALRRRFLELSSQCHPDAQSPAFSGRGVETSAPARSQRSAPTSADTSPEGGTLCVDDATAQFASLNSAYQTLRDAKLRLAHLLELETGAPPSRVQPAGTDLADLFFQVGALCRQVDAFLAERVRASSPLAKAALFARGLEWTTRLQTLQQSIAQSQAEFDAELQRMNAHWADLVHTGAESATGTNPPTADAPTPLPTHLARLEEIYRHLSYLSRWSGQLQERLVQLAV